LIRDEDFDRSFETLFSDHFPRLFRFLDRLSGDPDLASDLAQEAFVKLYQRGALPDEPGAWLAAVAMNRFRNHRRTGSTRRRLLTLVRAARAHSDPAALPDAGLESDQAAASVRRALARLGDREKSLLLLRAEGYSYREIARAVDVAEASVGTLLARARESFKRAICDAT
jgi:RNA polymerase sigma-70 factor (ECF subfamily)